MQRMLEGVEDEAGLSAARDAPADNAPRENVDDEGDVEFGMEPPWVRGPCRTPVQVAT